MSTQISGSLISRNYANFRGVDFSNRKDEVSIYRSPDALNMWKNYRNNNGIETRPDIELLKEYSDTIYGLFFYKVNDVTYKIVHSGTKLYKDDKLLYDGMIEHKSNMFVYNNMLYIMDSNKYLRYDGTEIKEVDGYIPTTTIGRSPMGGGTLYEDVNLLQPLRKNGFSADGTSVEYVLDTEGDITDIKVWVNGEEETNFTYEGNKIVFNTPPTAPETTGQDNVIIQFKKEVKGYRERITNCTLVETFDNRVFFSGNSNYKNMLWHCSLDNPEYCSDLDYYAEGTTDSSVKAIVPGNNALWVMKEPSQSNTTIFYHNPTIDSNYGKIYPSTHSSISTGCVAKAINFNDSISFFSDRGMEVISSDVTTEQVIRHTSSFVDGKLLNETKYREMILEEWEGYLLVIVGNKIYLADSRTSTQVNNHVEYEWFYWEFNNEITSTYVKDKVLYLCCNNEMYSLTDYTNTRKVESYWTTLEDEFKYPQYQKTSNKKGCVIDIDGSSVIVSVKTDKKPMSRINTYKNVKGYVVSKIKMKKWKHIQLKLSSNSPFTLYSLTLEAYIGNYVKR